MKENDFPRHLTRFLSQYLPGQKNVSSHTVAAYRDTFKLFLTYCEAVRRLPPERLTMAQLTKDLVLGFLDWLETDRNCSIPTRNHRLAVLHSFVKYVQKEFPENLYETQKILAIPYKKSQKPLVSYLTGAEMRMILSQPDSHTKDGFRDLVLLSVLYDTAARVDELINLKVKHVRLVSPAVITLHGKGNKVRQVPLMNNTKSLLVGYMDRRKISSGMADLENFLFVNQKRQKLSRWGISYIINKYVDQAKKNLAFTVHFPVTPHIFRHSKAMHLLQSGVNLIYIRDFLGHSDCSTTEIYARADSEMKRKAIENAYPDLVPEGLPKWEEDGDMMRWLSSLCK
jgi:site-specific recombinase XerD